MDVRFIRNPNKEEFESGKYLIYTNTARTYNTNDFVPVPVKAGKLERKKNIGRYFLI